MNDKIDVMARTIYGEARGEYAYPKGGLSALIGVGNVIMNRYHQQSWFGNSISEVCLKPFQFSCWNEGDPNLSIIKSVENRDLLFAMCLHVARKIIEDQWPDLTNGSTHYHNESIKPIWAKNCKYNAYIGRHVFYKIL